MKVLLSLVLFGSALFALCVAGPTRRFKFTKGNSGTSGRGSGDETSVDTESKVQGGEDGGAFAETRGAGAARGRGESSLDLESWAGFEGFQTGGAGGGGRAVGDQTLVETDSDVFIGEDSGVATSGSRGGAQGARESAIDLESFSELGDWSSGSAGGGGRALGDETRVKSESSSNTEFGRGTMSRSGSEGSAFAEDRLASVDLENFAGVDETNSGGTASVKAIGNKVSGSSGSSSLHGADGEIQAGSESEGRSESVSGRGGIRTRAEVNEDEFAVRAGSDGRGEGDLVITGGSSKTGLTNTKSAGQSESFARSSGRGSSFAESGATLVIGADQVDEPQEVPDVQQQQ